MRRVWDRCPIVKLDHSLYVVVMSNAYDIVIAGGGIAGSALGFVMQQRGARVLIAETTLTFRDRVRGESLHPWGVAEVSRLGLEAALERACARPARYWDTYIEGTLAMRRELATTSPCGQPEQAVHHPELQSSLLAAAEEAAVEVRRGCRVTRVVPGSPAHVELVTGDRTEAVTARLVVLADGRESSLRKALQISTQTDPAEFCVTGVLLSDVSCPDEGIALCVPQTFGAMTLVIPLSAGRCRVYLVQASGDQTRRYSGPAQLTAMLQHCTEAGASKLWFAAAQQAGPLASFEPTCITLPAAPLPTSVALIGDAAGTVDPAYGCGMSLALRDVRFLSTFLLDDAGDWKLAVERYAQERRTYHQRLLRVERWLTRLLFATGASADALRARAMPRLHELGVDLVGLGPDSASDDQTERALFA